MENHRSEEATVTYKVFHVSQDQFELQANVALAIHDALHGLPGHFGLKL